MATRRLTVRAGVRPRKFVDEEEEAEEVEEFEEGLRSESYIGRVSDSGGSSSTGDGSSSCIAVDDTEPREVVALRGGKFRLDDMLRVFPKNERYTMRDNGLKIVGAVKQ